MVGSWPDIESMTKDTLDALVRRCLLASEAADSDPQSTDRMIVLLARGQSMYKSVGFS